MKKTAVFILISAMAWTLMAQQSWWNKDWKQRVKITLNAGMSPGEDPIASAKIASTSQKIDLSSARLIDSDGKEVPCILKKDMSGDYFIGWRPKGLKMLEKRTYYAYFGEKPTKTAETPENMPESLPGMNLIPNANFAKLDVDGHPDGWNMSSKGYGIKDKWTDANKNLMKVVVIDGKKALELGGCATVYVKVKADRQYRLSYDAKYDAEYFAVTVWYRGKTIHEYLAKELNIGNYKMSTSPGIRRKWQHVAASTFIYFDGKTKKTSMNNKKLLKYTEMAFIQLFPRNGKGWIANIRYEDVTNKGSLKTKVDELETQK
jgi:hypothetical protein